MNDLISRQAAIDALAEHEKSRGHNYTMFVDVVSECAEIIRDVPSAQPGMKGRWMEITESDVSGYDPVLAGYDDPVVGYVCSACHEGYEKEVMGEATWNYCPNCGADMRG